MSLHEALPATCLCGARLDCHNDLGVGGGGPQPGDISVCYHCGGVQIVGADGALRAPTSSELANLQTDPAFVAVTTAVRARIKARS